MNKTLITDTEYNKLHKHILNNLKGINNTKQCVYCNKQHIPNCKERIKHVYTTKDNIMYYYCSDCWLDYPLVRIYEEARK